MNSNVSPKQKILIASLLVVLALVGYFLLQPHTAQKKSQTGTVKTTYDSIAHEPIDTQLGVASETNGTPQGPYFAGFSKLLDDGLTLDQVNLVKQLLAAYPPVAKANRLSLAVDELKFNANDPSNPLNRNFTTRFALNLKQFYRLQVNYGGLARAQVVISSDTTPSQQLYDSGPQMYNAQD